MQPKAVGPVVAEHDLRQRRHVNESIGVRGLVSAYASNGQGCILV